MAPSRCAETCSRAQDCERSPTGEYCQGRTRAQDLISLWIEHASSRAVLQLIYVVLPQCPGDSELTHLADEACPGHPEPGRSTKCTSDNPICFLQRLQYQCSLRFHKCPLSNSRRERILF